MFQGQTWHSSCADSMCKGSILHKIWSLPELLHPAEDSASASASAAPATPYLTKRSPEELATRVAARFTLTEEPDAPVHLYPGRTFYSGDGRNDYCAALQMRAGDIIHGRAGFTIEQLLARTPGGRAGGAIARTPLEVALATGMTGGLLGGAAGAAGLGLGSPAPGSPSSAAAAGPKPATSEKASTAVDAGTAAGAEGGAGEDSGSEGFGEIHYAIDEAEGKDGRFQVAYNGPIKFAAKGKEVLTCQVRLWGRNPDGKDILANVAEAVAASGITVPEPAPGAAAAASAGANSK